MLNEGKGKRMGKAKGDILLIWERQKGERQKGTFYLFEFLELRFGCVGESESRFLAADAWR
jgi:hypothetical protein